MPLLAWACVLFVCQPVLGPVLGGCAPSAHNISYTAGHLEPDPARRDKVLDVVIGLNVFNDIRATRPENDPILMMENEIEWGDGRICINAEENYSAGIVPTQVTAVVANYIHDMQLFRGVVWGDTDEADYVLSGDLTFFYGRQAPALTSGAMLAIGILGGVVGTSIAETEAERYDTNGEVLIQLQNVVLRDPNGQIVAEIGTVSEYFIGYLPAGTCEVIYRNVDSRLPIFAHRLAYAVLDAFVTPDDPASLPEPTAPVADASTAIETAQPDPVDPEPDAGADAAETDTDVVPPISLP